FLNFIFQIGIFALNAINILARMASWIESHWNVVKWVAFPVITAVVEVIKNWDKLQHGTAVIFDRIRHGIAEQWNLIYSGQVGRVIRTHQWIQHQLDRLFHNVADTYDHIRHAIASAWDAAWDNTVGRARRGVSETISAITGLKNRVVSFFATA